jgi:iron complex outermembrane receptor protein
MISKLVRFNGRMALKSKDLDLVAAVGIALICLLGNPTYADEEEYLTEEDMFFDVPVASGASRFPQALNKAPASVIVIDRDMIEAAGAIQIPDLFRLLPGFQVYSPSYSHPVANYHTMPDGFPSRMEVNVDGRSVYEPFTNTVFWNTLGLDLEDIDYIEVVRGSNVSADGANATNGTINIVTKSPLETTGVTFRAEGGSNNTEDYSAGFSQTHNDLSYRISASYRSNDGFDDFGHEAVDDDSETISAGIKLLWAPSLQDSINIQIGYTDSDFTFDQGNANVEPDELFGWEIDLAYQNLDWSHQFNDKHAFKVAFFHNKTNITAIESTALLSELLGFPPGFIFPGVEDFSVVLGIDDGYSERYDLELSHTGIISNQFKFDWGADARLDKAKSQLHFSQDSSVSEENYRLFGNFEYSPIDWLTLNGGASLGYSETIDEHLSIRLAGNFHINSSNTIRLAANRARSAPTVLDANYYRTIHNGDQIYDLDVISDPDIKAEERDSLELGYYGYFYDGKLTLDLKLFVEDNDNLIDIQNDRDYQGPLSIDNEVTFGTNSLASEDQGFEAFLRWRPDQRWLMTFQYTHLSIDAEHVRRVNPTRASDRSNAVPEDMTSFLVSYDFGYGFRGSVSYFYQSAVDWKSASDVDSYDRLDLNVRKNFELGGVRARVDLIAQNAFGEDNTEYHFFQQFEPRYYLRLVTEF